MIQTIETAVRVWWRQCLRGARPVLDNGLWIEGTNFKPARERPDATWPRAVRRSVLWHDFQKWAERNNLLINMTQVGFYQQVSPFVYIANKGKQTRRYAVEDHKQTIDGEWVKVRGQANFVRLCKLSAHIAAYELLAGEPVGEVLMQDRVALSEGVEAFLAELEEARNEMRKQMLRGGI